MCSETVRVTVFVGDLCNDQIAKKKGIKKKKTNNLSVIANWKL